MEENRNTGLIGALLSSKVPEVILPDEPKPEFEKWGRGRPSKEKLAQRQKLKDWYRKVKFKYEPRI